MAFHQGQQGGGGDVITTYAAQIFEYVNLLRESPQAFIKHLYDRRNCYSGQIYRVPGTQIAIRTTEGVAGIDDAIAFLHSATPVRALSHLSVGLCKSCLDLCADAGPRGMVGNTLSDGTTIEGRVNRYGQWSGSLTECTAFGPDSALSAVLQWVVDDGNPARTHRLSLMNPNYSVAGVASGSHSQYNVMVVLSLAGNYLEAGSSPLQSNLDGSGGSSVGSPYSQGSYFPYNHANSPLMGGGNLNSSGDWGSSIQRSPSSSGGAAQQGHGGGGSGEMWNGEGYGQVGYGSTAMQSRGSKFDTLSTASTTFDSSFAEPSARYGQAQRLGW